MHNVVVTFIQRAEIESDEFVNNGTGGTFGQGLHAPRMIDGVTVVGPFNSPGVSKTPSRERIFICQPQAGEGAPANLAEKLRHDGRHIADRSQQDSLLQPMPITPSSLCPAQAEPLTAATTAPCGGSRAPRNDELTHNQIRAAQRRARGESYPDKRGKTLMQRLASIGLGRSEFNDARNSIDEDSLDIPAYQRRVTT